ncbi:MAG: hypothetical protein IJJ10_06425 [Bacillus sp. (in: Bacteria)]|nr:hypothetical protein [Bacillus sp. (in: firmicutes)]
MSRYEELAAFFENVDANKKEIILSLLSDFVFYEEKIKELRKYPQYIVNPSNPNQQKTLPIHRVLKDYQAQKNDIAVKILRTIDGNYEEDSPLAKALAKFNS